MTTRKRNEYLDIDSEDEDRLSSGYDSGAAEDVELSRVGNHSKRRKISQSSSASLNGSESDSEAESLSDERSEKQVQSADSLDARPPSPLPTSALNGDEKTAVEPASAPDIARKELNPTADPSRQSSPTQPPTTTTATITTTTPSARPRPRGVIYLSRIPPFMRPSTVRSLLSQHGPITRLFLTPEPPSSYLGRRARGGNKKKSYIDGWVEFASRRDARICTEAINAQTIGRKAGFYSNDVWNARYLKGFSWTDLMAGARAEEREREERVRIGLGREMRERKAFLTAVESGRRDVAMREKREKRKMKRVERTNLAAAGDVAAKANANANTSTNPGETLSTSTAPPHTDPPTQPSSSTTNPKSTSKSTSTPRPEMRFRQHALAPSTTARAPPSTTGHTGGGGGGGGGRSGGRGRGGGGGGLGGGRGGELGRGSGGGSGRKSNGAGKGGDDRDGMVTRVLRQIF